MHAVIGRDAELEAIERFLDGLPSAARALLIDGEAGIGKTTVWSEAIAAAERRSYRVLRAQPAEREALLSYAALADLLEEVFEERRAELPAPQQRALDSALLQAEVNEAADPRTTATALVTVLGVLARQQPVVMAVDDVQWLDPASARALEFAARRLPTQAGLLLARRTDAEADAEPPLGLSRALTEDRLDRLTLGPLSLGALHHLIRGRLGAPPGRPTLVRIAEASGGNPFYALELARAAATSPEKAGPGGPLAMPRTLQELVAARIQALSPAAHEAALVVSALSRPTVAYLEAALGEQHHRSAVAEAEDAGVLLVGRDEHIRFSHPLLASAVYGAASAAEHRRVHRRLARIVTDAEERARHRAQSETEPNERIAAELATAAEAAALRGAPLAAAELYGAARRLTPPEAVVHSVRRALDEGRALEVAGEHAHARSLAEWAFAEAPTDDLRAQGLLLLSAVAWAASTPQTAIEHLEQALALADDDLRVRIESDVARFAVVDPVNALRHAEHARSAISEQEEPGRFATVLVGDFFARALLGRCRASDLGRALEHQRRAGLAAATGVMLPLLQWLDELEAARERYRLEDERDRHQGADEDQAERLAVLALTEWRAGECELAGGELEQCCATLELYDAGGPYLMAFGYRSIIDAQRGRVDRARATLIPLIERAENAEQTWWTAQLQSALGWVEFAAGHHAAAVGTWTEMAAQFAAIGIEDALPDRSEPDHIESLLALGELDRARSVLQHLEWRGRVLPRLWIDVALPRARALVLAADGEVDRGIDALAELDRTRAARLPFELARALLVEGRLHRRRKRKRAAADDLEQAVELFERLGAATWADQARAELGRVGLRHVDGDELTPTERRIAELAASGLTNREVAKAAFVSPKTVEANLARVYRKLGIASRAELGARMAERP